jgi:hypothetical protein
MATADFLSAHSASSSASRMEPGSYPLLGASLPICQINKCLDAAEVVSQWLSSFQSVLHAGGDYSGLQNLFLTGVY